MEEFGFDNISGIQMLEQLKSTCEKKDVKCPASKDDGTTRKRQCVENRGESRKKNVSRNISSDIRFFDVDKDRFHISTHMVKMFSYILDCMKDKVVGMIRFGPGGMNIFALYSSRTVCVSTSIGKELFSTFECSNDVHMSVDLQVFAKKLNGMQRFKIEKLTFKNFHDELLVTGESENQSPSEIQIRSLIPEFEELDVESVSYKVSICVRTSELIRHIDYMPPLFSISIEDNCSHIVFTGKEIQCTTRSKMYLEPEIQEEVRKYPAVKNYSGTFIKSNLSPIVRGSKLSEHVLISLSDGMPLFVRYMLNEKAGGDRSNESYVSMYFSPRLEEDEL